MISFWNAWGADPDIRPDMTCFLYTLRLLIVQDAFCKDTKIEMTGIRQRSRMTYHEIGRVHQPV